MSEELKICEKCGALVSNTYYNGYCKDCLVDLEIDNKIKMLDRLNDLGDLKVNQPYKGNILDLFRHDKQTGVPVDEKLSKRFSEDISKTLNGDWAEELKVELNRLNK